MDWRPPSSNIEDDVAALEAVIRRRAVGVDRGDRDALVAGADRAGRRKGQAKARYSVFRSLRASVSLALIGQCAEGERHGLLRALAEEAELDGGAGRHRTDLARPGLHAGAFRVVAKGTFAGLPSDHLNYGG
jgi:hypothetical protein